MGVGKTTVCQQLKQDLQNSVFIDGDWCWDWDASPFQVTGETKAMVIDNICHLLNNFLRCSVYKNIIFCWVMHEQRIINSIIEKLDTKNCTVHCISLIVNEKCLQDRLSNDIEKGIRTADILEKRLFSDSAVPKSPGQKQILFRYLFYIIPITCYYSVQICRNPSGKNRQKKNRAGLKASFDPGGSGTPHRRICGRVYVQFQRH